MKKLLAICGSTRENSSNSQIIKAVEQLIPQHFRLELAVNLSGLPHFNPDLDQEEPPQPVIDFRSAIANADGILICTPEYAKGLPGSFKNAIDWTVSSASLSRKPTLAIVASSQGEMAAESLSHILTVLEVRPIAQLISFARTKVNAENQITDETTLKTLISNITKWVDQIESPASI